MLLHYSWKVKVQICNKLHTRSTFSHSVMVSVGISKLSFTDFIFVYPGVKINGGYYRDVLLSQQLLPVMRDMSGDFMIFQQDSAPAHRTCDFATLCNFLSSQHPLLFLQICGCRIARTLIRSITRYGVTSIGECISRSCTALTN